MGSRFDEAWECSVDAEMGEMGESAVIYSKLNGDVFREVEGVKTDYEETNAQTSGGKRKINSFKFFTSAVMGDGVVRGMIIDVSGQIGRVQTVEDLDGAGVEITCGPVTTWNGRVPGV